MATILLIEDDPWLRDLYGGGLEQLNDITVLYANSADAGLVALDSNEVDLVVLDIFLDAHNGIEFLHEIASYSDTQKLPVIILSAVLEHDFSMSPERWHEYGVVKYLYKPNTKPADLRIEVQKQLSVSRNGGMR